MDKKLKAAATDPNAIVHYQTATHANRQRATEIAGRLRKANVPTTHAVITTPRGTRAVRITVPRRCATKARRIITDFLIGGQEDGD